MSHLVEAYLDIETTGLSPSDCEITVVGIHLCNGDESKCVQLVGRDITPESILEALKGADMIYTYNGQQFDLPFIHRRVGINLAEIFPHHDLMYDCWRNNLYGGFKAVERQLGIARALTVGVLYSIPLLVLIPISTFILGLVVRLPVIGLVIFFVFDVPWWFVLGTLLGSSWLWLKVPFLRPFLLLPGILVARVGDIYVSLIPDMGERYQKVLKMGFCDSWPYTYLVWRRSLDVRREIP